MIELQTLGVLRLVSDDAAVSDLLRQPKRAALLVAIAANRAGQGVARDSLLAMFWPESEQTQARHALNQALYALRTALRSGVLVNVGSTTLVVDPSRLRCDAAEFDRLVGEKHFREAAKLYRGPFLDGFHVPDAIEFSQWVDGRRRELEHDARRAFWEVARAARECGQLARAARWAHRATALGPTDEIEARRIVEFLASLGDRAAAVRTGEELVRRLQIELELEPSQELLGLIDDCRRASGEAGHIRRLATTDGRSPPDATPGPGGSAASHVDTNVERATRGRRIPRTAWAALPLLAIVGLLITKPPTSDGRHLASGLAGGGMPVIRSEAREAYDRAQLLMASAVASAVNVRHKDTLLLAIDLLQRAVTIDPRFAEAFAALSTAHSWMAMAGDGVAERLELAERAARSALSLNDRLADAHLALGHVLLRGYGDARGADPHYLRALELEPDHPGVLYSLGITARELGDWERAKASLRAAIAADPFNPLAHGELGLTLFTLGEFAAADQALSRALSVEPANGRYLLGLINVRLSTGDLERARQAARQFPALRFGACNPPANRILRDVFDAPLAGIPDGDCAVPGLGHLARALTYRMSADAQEARAEFERAAAVSEQWLRGVPGHTTYLAVLHAIRAVAYAGLDRRNDAFAALRDVDSITAANPSRYAQTSLEWWSTGYRRAEAFVVLGEVDSAKAALRDLLAPPSQVTRTLITLDPLFEGIREDLPAVGPAPASSGPRD